MADPAPDPLDTTAGWGRWRWLHLVLVAGALATGLLLRFYNQSPLWLDETLSVNIAGLPLGELTDALRHDGHPPLYYALLHGWMELFGTEAGAVRSFSGLWSLALFPLLWVAARRVGGHRVAMFAVALLALSPFAIRYATETRMYTMVSVLALAMWLVVEDALRRPTRVRLVGVSLLVAALLWTHYWSMWLLAAGTLGLLVHGWRARRDGRGDHYRASVQVLVAMVVGGVLFLPWVPHLLYQSAHTGTPWARPVRPTEMVTFTAADLGGGPLSEAVLLGWMLVVAVLLGLFGRAEGRFDIDLDLRTRRAARPFFILISGTLAIACVVGYATGATYATRYASVFFPFLLVLAALGLDQLRSRPVAIGALAVLLGLGGVSSLYNARLNRSDAPTNVEAIVSRGQPGDWVVYCPDQLGPSTSRLMPAGFEQATFPAFEAPGRVDWVDYKERLEAADPEQFVAELLERAGDRQIFLVSSTTYQTHEEICPEVFNALGASRTAEVLTQPTDAYEPATVALFTVSEP